MVFLNVLQYILVLIQRVKACRYLIIFYHKPNVFQKRSSVNRVHLMINVLGLSSVIAVASRVPVIAHNIRTEQIV